MKQVSNKKVLFAIMLLLLAVLASGCYTEPEITTGGNSGFNGAGVFPTIKASAPPVTNAPTKGPLTPTPNIGGGVTIVTPTPGTGGPIISFPSNNPSNQPIVSFKPTTPSPTPTSSVLKEGAKGDAVREMQKKLIHLGYLKGSADGDFGKATKDAVIAFQKANRITADGVVGLRTLEKLAVSKVTAKPTPSPTPKISQNTFLKVGSQNDEVKKLQGRLIDLGYLSGLATGKFDRATESAVIAFQDRNMSYSDGIAGPETLKKVYSSSARSASTSSGVIGIVLKEGLKGSTAVKTMQRRLKELGYYKGSIDGDFGGGTVDAVRAFQKRHGLHTDGKAGPTTLSAMFDENAKKANQTITPKPTHTPRPDETKKPSYTNPPQYVNVTVPPAGSDYITLRLGHSGTLVKRVQTALRAQGYFDGSSDGKYGKGTAEAVRAFQKSKGLRQDGVAGPATQRVLFEGDFPKES